jgi:hypothetical protein
MLIARHIYAVPSADGSVFTLPAADYIQYLLLTLQYLLLTVYSA